MSCLVSATTDAFSAPIVLGGNSHLTFWHETPPRNPTASSTEFGEYYMLFAEKADYRGSSRSRPAFPARLSRPHRPAIQPHRDRAVRIGKLQPLATSGDPRPQDKILPGRRLARARTSNRMRLGLSVWNHHFDWEYRDTLKAPWYSGSGARAGNFRAGPRPQRIRRSARILKRPD